MSGDFLDIRSLASLLKEPGSDSDSDSERKPSFHPGSIGGPTGKEKVAKNVKNVGKQEAAGPKSGDEKVSGSEIWSSGELPGSSGREGEILIPDISNDPRKRPSVDIQYMQNLATEDIFLSAGSKTQGSSSCEWIVVKILLPGESDHNSFNLDVKEHWIELRTELYALIHPMPHQINPRLGNAKWDKDESTLTLNLRIVRELDLFNDV